MVEQFNQYPCTSVNTYPCPRLKVALFYLCSERVVQRSLVDPWLVKQLNGWTRRKRRQSITKIYERYPTEKTKRQRKLAVNLAIDHIRETNDVSDSWQRRSPGVSFTNRGKLIKHRWDQSMDICFAKLASINRAWTADVILDCWGVFLKQSNFYEAENSSSPMRLGATVFQLHAEYF